MFRPKIENPVDVGELKSFLWMVYILFITDTGCAFQKVILVDYKSVEKSAYQKSSFLFISFII